MEGMSDIYAVRASDTAFSDALLLENDLIIIKAAKTLEVGFVYYVALRGGPGCFRRVRWLTEQAAGLSTEIAPDVTEEVPLADIEVQGRLMSMIRRYYQENEDGKAEVEAEDRAETATGPLQPAGSEGA